MSAVSNSQFAGQKLSWFWLWLLLGYLYLAYIVYGSLTPNPIEVDVADFDKVMHFSAYALLMIWFAMIFYQTRARIFHAVAFIGLGVGMEFAQQAGGVRFFEFSDMLANSLGVLAGYFVTRGCGKYHLLRIEQQLLKRTSAK
ncbi:MAG: VanZ family protein [Gammaproteobacteria bacterium]|nr:VanZ family protein [Gammaproteobacteria bacterium]